MPTRADHLAMVPDAAPQGGDLEAALAKAEAAVDAAAEAEHEVEASAGAEHESEAEVEAATAAPSQAPTPAVSAGPAPSAAASKARLPPIATAMPALTVGRYRLHPALQGSLLSRQLAWVAWSALVVAVLAGIGMLAAQPAVVVALALGMGAWAARPKRFVLGPAVAAATVGTVLLVGLLTGDMVSTATLTGSQVLAAGAVAGLGATFMDGASADRWRRVHGTLGGAAGAGVGWWAATSLIGVPGEAAVAGAMQGAVLGLVGSQALVAGALQWRTSDRVPKLARIRATLGQDYRPPAVRARQLDQVFSAQAPDPDTRDGLGEVAAWIYRLQWTLQSLDREIVALDGEGLESKRLDLLQRASESQDPFTAERLEATARHLAQLTEHRDALTLERGRTAAMREYASAFLEEARAGLALARVQPGELAPDRLGDVLGRLRAHAKDGDARRRTARELDSLA